MRHSVIDRNGQYAIFFVEVILLYGIMIEMEKKRDKGLGARTCITCSHFSGEIVRVINFFARSLRRRLSAIGNVLLLPVLA